MLVGEFPLHSVCCQYFVLCIEQTVPMYVVTYTLVEKAQPILRNSIRAQVFILSAVLFEHTLWPKLTMRFEYFNVAAPIPYGLHAVGIVSCPMVIKTQKLTFYDMLIWTFVRSLISSFAHSFLRSRIPLFVRSFAPSFVH